MRRGRSARGSSLRIARAGGMLGIVLLAGMGLGAKEAGDPKAVGAAEGLEARIEVYPARTLPGLPVAVVVRLKNVSDVDRRVVGFVIGGSLGLEVQSAGKRRSAGAKVSHEFASRWIMLKPGESHAFKAWIHSDAREEFFPTPGEYRVVGEVFYKGQGGHVPEPAPRITVATTVEVVEVLEEARESRELFLHPGIAYGFWPGNYRELARFDRMLPGLEERLESLAADHAGTPYGKYARYVLAAMLASKAMGEGPRWGTPWTYPEASAAALEGLRRSIGLLEGLLKDGPPENLVDEVRLDLAHFRFRLGEYDRTLAALVPLEGRSLPEPLAERYEALRAEAAARRSTEGEDGR